MIAHSAVLKQIAVAANRPPSEVLQSARILGENGLYDRPGRGARNPRLTISSLANVALAIAGGGPMTADETVRHLRPLLPQGTWETWGEPKNRLSGWSSGTNYLERFVDNRPLWPGATLGAFLEELIDLTAAANAVRPWREAEPRLVGFFRSAELEIRIPAGDPPIAVAHMFMPKQEGEAHQRLWSCAYLPAEADGVKRQLNGVSLDGVIRFPFIEALASLWCASLGMEPLPITA